MPVTLLPLMARASQSFNRRSFMERAEETIEVSPRLVQGSRPALCLPDDPSRVISYQPLTSPTLDKERLAGQADDHLPTVLRRFTDVTIIDGIAYKGLTREAVANSYQRRPLVFGAAHEIERAMLCTNPVIDLFFGHWLLDGRLLEMLAADNGLEALPISGKKWLHEDGYRQMLGTAPSRPPHVHVKELFIADDRGTNASWRDRGERLRSRLREALPAEAASEGSPVFVRRGTSGARRHLKNEDALADFLVKRGFIILDPEHADALKIATTLARAPMIVMVEGSAQVHALLAARPGATLISIMPPRLMNGFIKIQADALGVGWAYTVAADERDGAFYQSTERMSRMIDLVGGG